MGLDMYVYRMCNPSLDADKVYTSEELGDYHVLAPSSAASPLNEQLLPYGQKLRVINSYYDIEKMRADLGLQDAHIFGVGPQGIMLYGTKDGEDVHALIGADAVKASYTIEREEDCIVLWVDQVAYWRKEYALQEIIHDALGGHVQNVGYYKLDEEAVARINDYAPVFEWEPPTESSALFYHEWY